MNKEFNVEKLYSLEEEIIKIFQDKPKTKEDDMLLYYEYCEKKLYEHYEFNGIDIKNGFDFLEDFKDIFSNTIWRENLNVSPYSAVERCARKIRARENKVNEAIIDKELVFKQYALDKE